MSSSLRLVLHVVMLIAMIGVMFYQGSDSHGPAANISVIVGTAVLVGFGLFGEACSKRYADNLAIMADIVLLAALVMAVWAIAVFRTSAPPFYSIFPLVLFVVGDIVHAYVIYDAQMRTRSQWLDNMRVPLANDGDVEDTSPPGGPPTVGVRSHRRNPSGHTTFEVSENPFATGGHKFVIGEV